MDRLRAAPQGDGARSSYPALVRTNRPNDGDDARRKALVAIYGPAFPLALDAPTDDDWGRWPEILWEQHREGVADTVHLGERNRRFYWGDQWISSSGGSRGPWREPPTPKNQVRIVDNRVKPALDWRIQVVTEQRPGFRFEPTDIDPDDKRRAEAKQKGVEYQWHQQNMQAVLRESAFWSSLHGAAFLYSYWDPNLGPWDELMPGEQMPLGDIATRVLRMDQVRVSANATATVKPHYWIVREDIPIAQGILEHGEDIVEADVAQEARQNASWLSGRSVGIGVNAIAPLFRSQRMVARYLVFCEKSDYLPGGCQLVVVGKKVVYGPKPLTIGRAPIVRVTDGSPDPRFFPRPFFADWVAPQTQINKLQSLWFQSIRVNAGGRIFAKPNTLATETLVGGGLSLVEVRTAGPIGNSILPADGFSVGNDVKEALQVAVKRLEDMTGWNDTARGSLGGDPSGRAVLAIREQLERVFAPPVAALALSSAEWAEVQVLWMRWGYKMPRAIAVTGTARPDLGRMLVSEDLDGAADCHVNPETMMPQPTSLRLFQLDQLYDRQIIDGREYRRRSPFAETSNIETPDDLQEAKAKRVCEAFRLGIEPEPMSWVDDEAIHQDVIQHEILLAPNIEQYIKDLAFQRWSDLANQAAAKAGGMPPSPEAAAGSGAPGDQGAPGAESLFAPTPQAAPIAGANPSTAAAPAPVIPSMAGATAQGAAAQTFEQAASQ
jgi:hypothetical protein